MTRRIDTELDPPTPAGARGPARAPGSTTAPPAVASSLARTGDLLVPAQPGRRDEAPSDMAVTARLERVSMELTPAPLPPSPASEDADRYFEQVPTNPGATSRRDPSSATVQRQVSGVIRPSAPPAPPPQTWLLPVLLVATALAVGMVLGALLFANRGPAPCAPCPPAAVSR